MATAPDLMLTEQEEPPIASDALTLQDILSGQNLAELLDEAKLCEIGQQVIRDYETDCSSREDWEKRYEKNIKIAMQAKEAKTFPWAGASNSKSPILTIAAIQFNAEAYPVIVDGSNLVKGRVLGPDQDGEKRARADRIGQHMTWQLLYRMPGWEDETDRLLLMLPIVGCMFRKTYYDSIENANRSDIVNGLDFVIHNDAKSIESAPRYTQVLHLYPYEVQSYINAGLWLDVPRDDENAGDDDESLGDYYEQHRCLDLDGDDYPEHYVVTCTKEGKVARIVPCFGPEDITFRRMDTGATSRLKALFEDAQKAEVPLEVAMQVVGPIVKIDRRQYFTKYGFLPAPDGSFYDIGFGDLLANTTDLIDRLQNQMIDATTLQIAQGGFIGDGVNVRGGDFTFRRVGEWKRVNANGADLRTQIVPLALPGASNASFSLLEILYQQAKDMTSAQDVVAGKAPPNQPATTTLALIEQAGTVRKGIYKRINRSFGDELRILRRLNRDYLDEEEYFQLNDEDAVQIGRQDYADEDLDVVPVADPTQISSTHRMARAQAMFQMFNGNPLINQQKLYQQQLEALGATDIQQWFKVPTPPPPPEAMKIIGQLANEKDKISNDRIRALADAAQKYMTAAKDAAEIGLLEDAAVLAAQSVEESQEEENGPDQSGGVPGMGGPEGHEGVPVDPSLGPVPDDGGMGLGPDLVPGAAGAGGPVGGVGETPLQ